MTFFKIKNILFDISIVLFGIYPLIPERYESHVPITFIIVSFIFFLDSSKRQIMLRPLIIMSALFITFLISCFLSDNIFAGLKKIETMTSLIAMPITCFWFLRNTKLNFQRLERILFNVFFISNIIFSLVALYLLNFYRNPKFSSKDSDFFRNAITDIPFIGDHSIYISLFLSIAIIMGTFIYGRKNHNRLTKIGLLLGQLILMLTLLLLMSRGVIIALSMSFLIQFLLKRKNIKKPIIGAIFIIIMLIILIPKQNNRFVELFNKDSFEKVDLSNSLSIRYYILKCSLNSAFKKPFFGHGLGDVQSELNLCYEVNDTTHRISGYNSHNQYLFVWLSSGIFGLIIIIISLVYVFRIAIKHKDYFLLNILLLFMIAFLFENVLSRQSGVILFAFLINLFSFKNLNLANDFEKQ